MASLGHPCKFQRVSRLGSVTALHASSGRQPNCGVQQRAPPVVGRAAITLGIGPHSSLYLIRTECVWSVCRRLSVHTACAASYPGWLPSYGVRQRTLLEFNSMDVGQTAAVTHMVLILDTRADCEFSCIVVCRRKPIDGANKSSYVEE